MGPTILGERCIEVVWAENVEFSTFSTFCTKIVIVNRVSGVEMTV